jgi:hypothetical protein
MDPVATYSAQQGLISGHTDTISPLCTKINH